MAKALDFISCNVLEQVKPDLELVPNVPPIDFDQLSDDSKRIVEQYDPYVSLIPDISAIPESELNIVWRLMI